MEIEDAFTEEAVSTASLDEEDQQELRRIAGELYSTNQINDVESTIDVCVLFFAAGSVYADARPFNVEMTREEYSRWTEYLREQAT